MESLEKQKTVTKSDLLQALDACVCNLQDAIAGIEDLERMKLAEAQGRRLLQQVGEELRVRWHSI